jgi:DNA-binding IclR family transcriptional regulator
MLQSAERVVRVVEHLAEHETARLDEVASAIGVHKSNALRLLATLRALDWVVLEESRTQYSLGPRLISIGQAATAGLELHKALALAEDLRNLTAETVHVSVPQGNRMMVVGRVDSLQALKVTCEVGTEDPLHSTAVGKVYLATLSDEQVGETVSQLELLPSTPSTLATPEELLDEVRLTRQRRYAINDEEGRPGTVAMAVALRFAPVTPILALSPTGPSHRFTPSVIEELAPRVLELVEPYQAL